MAQVLTVSGLIEKLTPAVLAEGLAISVQAISNMKQRGAIPPRHWPAVVDLASHVPDLSEFGLAELVAMHTPPPRPSHRETVRKNQASERQRRVTA